MGVISTILLSAGVLRHYYDIYIHRTVRGISFIFVAIDAAGDVFSLVSICIYPPFPFSLLSPFRSSPILTQLVFQPKLDILGMVIYATEFVLWCGVFACGGYFNFIPWVKGKISMRGQEKSERNQVVSGASRPGIPLERMGSSTSVFRTPSSVAISRHVSRPAE
jgi:hypothetical protein